MPLVNEAGDVVLAFSGEEYPDPATPLRLKDRGHEVAAEGLSYLVHLYEEDLTFPANLNGMFHGLLIDRRQGTATLFNDRYGMHRLYYHQSKEAFYFGVEAKAILAVRPELRTPMRAASVNSSLAVASSKTAQFSATSTYCLGGRPGCFAAR